MRYVNCKKYAHTILDAVKAVPKKKKLVIFTAGDDAASAAYVRGKIRDCEYCGIPYDHITVNTEEELAWGIAFKRIDPEVGGIIIQLPLPKGWNADYFTNLVPFHLDVDGFVHNSAFKPCTAEGIMYILHKELGDLAGKNALVVGRGNLVGLPVAKMLLQDDCTVTVAHSKTKHLYNLIANSDIVVTGTGHPELIDLQLCWRCDIVVDAGIAKGKDRKLCGDCFNFYEGGEATHPAVTPVPGGVGLLTRAVLMAHVVGLDVSKL